MPETRSAEAQQWRVPRRRATSPTSAPAVSSSPAVATPAPAASSSVFGDTGTSRFVGDYGFSSSVFGGGNTGTSSFVVGGGNAGSSSFDNGDPGTSSFVGYPAEASSSAVSSAPAASSSAVATPPPAASAPATPAPAESSATLAPAAPSSAMETPSSAASSSAVATPTTADSSSAVATPPPLAPTMVMFLDTASELVDVARRLGERFRTPRTHLHRQGLRPMHPQRQRPQQPMLTPSVSVSAGMRSRKPLGHRLGLVMRAFKITRLTWCCIARFAPTCCARVATLASCRRPATRRISSAASTGVDL
mmetsp:Transcript_74890/g.243289  ORF Transcript_74890/g.243289 Transcript_74890/m.243289 type:complete len:306 (-) Transcript_74890:111-1028(-)